MVADAPGTAACPYGWAVCGRNPAICKCTSAASPAQEATPPRCHRCKKVMDPGEATTFTICSDCWRPGERYPAPTPEASAPREVMCECGHKDVYHEGPMAGGDTSRLGRCLHRDADPIVKIARKPKLWPCECAEFKARPAREASSAPGEEAETEQYRQIALHLNDTRLNMEPVSVNQVRHIARSLRATVAALTAERGEREAREADYLAVYQHWDRYSTDPAAYPRLCAAENALLAQIRSLAARAAPGAGT